MVIKRTPDGKIITRGGKPSCTCCGCATVDCDGLWGPGYDNLPGDVFVKKEHDKDILDWNLNHYRVTKCWWPTPGYQAHLFYISTSDPGGYPGQDVAAVGPCMWVVIAHEEPVGSDPLVFWNGYRAGSFESGPGGQYFSNPDGLTGTLYYTVTAT